MPQLLLELFSEEIPARMQARAEADLGRALGDALKAAGLSFDAIATCSGPRRLAVVVDGLPATSKDVREERKGPKVGAPEKAVEGFLRGAGLTSIDEAEVREDPKKGAFYVAVIEKPGAPTPDLVAQAAPEIVRGFHWPKSMRWGAGDLRWVRPLQRILCVFDGAVVPFEVGGIRSGNETEGHRVMGRGPFTVTGWDDYQSQLEGDGHVRLTREARSQLIAEEASRVCAERGLELVEDKGLLEEVTGLAEWPVALLGDMDPAFLDLPPEVIRLSMRTHQKYFAVRDPETGDLAPHFVVIANQVAPDGGDTIAAGNARVLSARLEDARFFWENDKKTPLEQMGQKLATIEFKKELGSIADKVERVAELARELAPKVGADRDLAERAARLSKADLVSEMVYEFPELQGVMGRYYARAQGEPDAVADAIRDHYKPQGPADTVPTDPVSVAVALADKLDTLTGFWAIDEKPTGSKDPFALRRAALGVIRLILDNGLRLGLDRINDAQVLKHQVGTEFVDWSSPAPSRLFQAIVQDGVFSEAAQTAITDFDGGLPDWSGKVTAHDPAISDDLLSFVHDRLKVHLREAGAGHDLIDACLAMPDRCDLMLLVRRVEALGRFLDTEDGANLLAGYKRAANILRAEEKKDGAEFSGDPAPDLFDLGEERVLHEALIGAAQKAQAALEKEDFEAAMAELATLRGPVDAFFEAVMVNAEDTEVRANRLKLLAFMRDAMGRVADFSKVEG